MWGRDGGVYAMFPLCRCLFCLSKQHMQQQQQQSLLRKGTSRRGRRQFFIYQFQLSSLGFWEFNLPPHPLQYKLLAELLLADKKDNPKEDYAACNWVPFSGSVFYQPQTDRDRHCPPFECGATGGKAWKMSHKMQIKTQVSFEPQPFASLSLCLCLCASLSAAAFEFYASDDASAACGSHSVTGT